MEIYDIQSLWRNFNAQTPFNESVVRDDKHGKLLYIDGEIGGDGRVRILLTVLKAKEEKAVIVYIPNERTPQLPKELAAYGYTVIGVDIYGMKDGTERCTLYPKSKSVANFYQHPEAPFNPREDCKANCHYIWTCVALRAYAYAQTLNENIFFMGSGLGAATAYRAAAIRPDCKGVATIYGALVKVSGNADELIGYRAALDNEAYAASLVAPCFMMTASNDSAESFDYVSRLARRTASLKKLFVAARSTVVTFAEEETALFFDDVLSGFKFAPVPKLEPRNNGGTLYFDVVEQAEVQRIDGYVCTSAMSAYRNWTGVNVTREKRNYTFKCNAYDAKTPIGAFVTVVFADGRTCSSTLCYAQPETLGIKPIKLVPRRLFYESSMGTDSWIAPNGEVLMKEGVSGIEGITSTTNALETFKPGDILYKAVSNLLQFIVCGKTQTLKILATDDTGKVYTANFPIKQESGWNKLNLAPQAFTAPEHLEDWSHVVKLEFVGEDEFIISSLVWI